jgi:hypothetical protein
VVPGREASSTCGWRLETETHADSRERQMCRGRVEARLKMEGNRQVCCPLEAIFPLEMNRRGQKGHQPALEGASVQACRVQPRDLYHHPTSRSSWEAPVHTAGTEEEPALRSDRKD